MRYPVKSMDNAISTISASVNRSRISKEVHVSHGTSDASDSTDRADRSTQRKSRWQNTPGIRVSLQSLDQQPQLDEYQQLRFDGRRKDSTKVAGAENINRTIEADQFNKKRSVSPRSKIILDSFIQQMGGAEQSLSSGSTINTSV
jgi:hypothetical protein